MGSSVPSDRSWILNHCSTNSYTGQTGAEYGPCLLSAHYSGLSGGNGQGVNPGITSTAYPGTSVPGPSFHTPPSCYEEGPSFYYSNQQGSAYAIPPQALLCDYTSRVPATVSDRVLCDSGGNQNTGAYPSNAPAEQWDSQAAILGPTSYMQPPYVAPSLPKNKAAVTSASPETSIIRGNVIWDKRWNQDMGTYPALPAQPDSQVALGSILGNTGDKQPASVVPLLFEDKAASIASTVSTPKGPRAARNTDKYCPICTASLGRSQERKRHISSHLPHWLQCHAFGCSWRGDRWEHLKKHRSKHHPSMISQASDTHESIIYDPWPLVRAITDDATFFKNAKAIAISLVEERAEELNKSELWGDSWGRKRRSRKVYRSVP